MTGLPAGYSLVALESIDSTNEEALRRAEAGAPHGTVVWARMQTGGRGRSGRIWSSPLGNTYVSILLRPQTPAAVTAQLSFAVAVAIAETFESLLPSGTPVACKWPNDVLVAEKKCVGILLQSRLGTDGTVAALVAGIGTNVATAPAGTDWAATCLAEAGATADVEAVAMAEVMAVDRWYRVWKERGFAPIRQAWLDRAYAQGRRIRARTGEREVHGIFETLDEGGALVLAGDDGKRHVITAGEVFPLA